MICIGPLSLEGAVISLSSPCLPVRPQEKHLIKEECALCLNKAYKKTPLLLSLGLPQNLSTICHLKSFSLLQI